MVLKGRCRLTRPKVLSVRHKRKRVLREKNDVAEHWCHRWNVRGRHSCYHSAIHFTIHLSTDRKKNSSRREIGEAKHRKSSSEREFRETSHSGGRPYSRKKRVGSEGT